MSERKSKRRPVREPDSAADWEANELGRRFREEFGDVFNEWQTPKAQNFFEQSGISCRNWRICMRYLGFADGNGWTLRAIADAENISHVRVWQIVRQTKTRLRKFIIESY